MEPRKVVAHNNTKRRNLNEIHFTDTQLIVPAPPNKNNINAEFASFRCNGTKILSLEKVKNIIAYEYKPLGQKCHHIKQGQVVHKSLIIRCNILNTL